MTKKQITAIIDTKLSMAREEMNKSTGEDKAFWDGYVHALEVVKAKAGL